MLKSLKANQKLISMLDAPFMDEDLKSNERGYKKDMSGITALYFDLDYATPDKPNAPPKEKALDLVCGHGIDPSVIIHTGNGYHIWWIFKESIEFENGDFLTAEKVNQRLQATIKHRAHEQGGWELDSTYDCTRVLRIPDTHNYKNGECKKVEIESDNGPRYASLDDFDDFILSEDQLPASSKTPHITDKDIKKVLENIIVDPNATAPVDRLEELFQIDPILMQTLEGSRTDMKDNSASKSCLQHAA